MGCLGESKPPPLPPEVLLSGEMGGAGCPLASLPPVSAAEYPESPGHCPGFT